MYNSNDPKKKKKKERERRKKESHPKRNERKKNLHSTTIIRHWLTDWAGYFPTETRVCNSACIHHGFVKHIYEEEEGAAAVVDDLEGSPRPNPSTSTLW